MATDSTCASASWRATETTSSSSSACSTVPSAAMRSPISKRHSRGASGAARSASRAVRSPYWWRPSCHGPRAPARRRQSRVRASGAPGRSGWLRTGRAASRAP
ncbi:hypothetical protein G6F59_016385 [Rhizopus arrhizus]|nr:hypothetical protein G6F59_016385 [Rhizopus arrhizus]